MKNLLILATIIGSITSLYAAADETGQYTIDATQQIASAHQRFLTSWKEGMHAKASDRALEFQRATWLKTQACYYDYSKHMDDLTLPASPHRLGLTGLIIGKNSILCLIANPDDPIPELTKPVRHHTYSLNDEERWTEPFYPTIWHFLASENGKKVIEEYRAAAPSR